MSLPDQQRLNHLFFYDRTFGRLLWRNHPIKPTLMRGKIVGERYDGLLKAPVDGTLYNVHEIIWKMNNGELPENTRLVFKDALPANTRLENLKVVPAKISRGLYGTQI